VLVAIALVSREVSKLPLWLWTSADWVRNTFESFVLTVTIGRGEYIKPQCCQKQRKHTVSSFKFKFTFLFVDTLRIRGFACNPFSTACNSRKLSFWCIIDGTKPFSWMTKLRRRSSLLLIPWGSRRHFATAMSSFCYGNAGAEEKSLRIIRYER